MKKFIAVLLSILILTSCAAVTAYAGEETPKDGDTVKDEFSTYLTEVFGKGENLEFRKLGEVDGYTIVYGYNHIDPIEGTTTTIYVANCNYYRLTTPATQGESAGLYLYKDGKFYPLNDKLEILNDNYELAYKIVDTVNKNFGAGLKWGYVIEEPLPPWDTESVETSATEPTAETVAETEPIAPQLVNFSEVDYLALMKQSGYDVDFANYVGTINDAGGNVDVLIYSSKGEIKEISTDKQIGDYIFSTALHSPDMLGLFVARFNYYRGWDTNIKPLSEDMVYYGVNMNKVYDVIKAAEKNEMRFDFCVRHKDGDDGIKCVKAIEKKYGDHDYCNVLGKVDDCYVVYAGNYELSPAIYSETFGVYTFVNYNYVAVYPLGLYIVKDDTAYTLADAYKKSIINDKGIEDISHMTGTYLDIVINENGKYGYGEVSENCIDAIWREFGKHDRYNVFEKVGDSYAVYAKTNLVREANFIDEIGSYRFENYNQVGKYELGLYIVNGRNAYTLKDAYEKSVISESDLNQIAEAVKTYIKEIKVDEIESLEKPTEPTITICPPPPTKIIKANPVKITVKTKTVKASKLKKAKQTVKPLTIKKVMGDITIVKLKKDTSAKLYKSIKINPSSGAITFSKGKYKKGTYKVNLKISVKGNKKYSSKTIEKIVKIKIN